MTPQARLGALETARTDKLDDAYEEARAKAKVLESELRRRYGASVAQAWHQVDDLVTVRYFQLNLRDPNALEAIYRKNKGDEHTGMTVEDLAHADRLLKRYHAALSEVVGRIENAEVGRVGRRRRLLGR